MVQKEFREIENWAEWLRLWRRNEIKEIAIGLLHAGPEVYQFSSDDRPEKGLKQELKRVRFYLKVAWLDGHPRNTAERMVGNKAYQVLVQILLWKLAERMKERWASDLPPRLESAVWGEIIDFFAHSKRSFSLDGEPYRSKARTFLTSLHSSLKDKAREPFLFDQKIKEILSQKKEDLARALVNVGAFDCLLQEEILEAIPALREKIAQKFPQGKEKWIEELEDLRSEAFRFALTHQEKETRVLMELIVRRAVPVST